MWEGIATSRAGDAAGGQLLVPALHLLPQEASGTISSDSLGGGLETLVDGGWQALLG